MDSMFYDALGRRVRKQMAAADEYYVYEGDQVIFDLNAAGTVLREYAWYPGGVDRLLALRATTPVVDTLAAILDPINGTVRGLARFRTGAKVKEFTEAPWGDAVADTGIVVRYHFAGREYDGESGLYYMRARYYDPALGRWISEDPIGIAGGLNVYAYAGNDPVNLTDPSGLDPDCKPIDVPPGPGQIPGIGQECKRPWNPFGPGGPLEWLDPSNECGMDVFHDPECSGYPDQDVLDYYSGLGGAEGDGGQTVDGPTAGLDPWASATGWATELIGCPATANGPLRFVTPSNWWVGIVPVPVTTRYTLWRKTKAGGVARYSGRAEIETRFSIGETVLVGSRTLQIAGTVTCAVGTFDFEAWDVGT